MLCPFCLRKVIFGEEAVQSRQEPVSVCPECKEVVPKSYIEDYDDFPPVISSVVGFRQHGKTIFFASLFRLIEDDLGNGTWNRFQSFDLNEESMVKIEKNVDLMKLGGEAPSPTESNVHKPTMIQLKGIPSYPQCTLLCFDQSGEVFENPDKIGQYANYLKHATTVVFLVDLSDIDIQEKLAAEMRRLLNIYVLGMREMGAKPKSQNLIVVYTKADRYSDELYNPHWLFLKNYLLEGRIENLENFDDYVAKMYRASIALRTLTEEKLQAHQFLNIADDFFKRVEFSIISSLGAEVRLEEQTGTDGKVERVKYLPEKVIPRRVIDPLLWTIECGSFMNGQMIIRQLRQKIYH